MSETNGVNGVIRWQRDLGWRLVQVLAGILILGAFGMSGAAIRSSGINAKAVQRIVTWMDEGDRFTQLEGDTLAENQTIATAAILARVHAVEVQVATIPKQSPPEDYRKYLDEKFGSLGQQLSHMRADLDRLRLQIGAQNIGSRWAENGKGIPP